MRIECPASLKEAYKAYEGSYIAGGTYAYSLEGGASSLVDILPLIGEGVEEKDGIITIKAGTALETIAQAPSIPAFIRDAALSCPSLQQRSMATIGGNAAQCRADGYMTAALLAANAELCIFDGTEERSLPYREYIKEHERSWIILSLTISGATEGSFVQIRRASHMHSAVTAACAGGLYAFTASPTSIAVGDREAYAGMEFADDLTGSAEYKRYLLSVIFEGGVDGNKS